MRLTHDDFVKYLNVNFDLNKALLIRKHFLDLCLEKIIEREELRIKQRRSNANGICSDIFHAFKICNSHESTFSITDLNDKIGKQLFEQPKSINHFTKSQSQVNQIVTMKHKKRKSDNENDDEDEDSDEICFEEWLNANQIEIDKLKSDNEKFKSDLILNKALCSKIEHENTVLKRDLERVHLSYVTMETLVRALDFKLNNYLVPVEQLVQDETNNVSRTLNLNNMSNDLNQDSQTTTNVEMRNQVESDADDWIEDGVTAPTTVATDLQTIVEENENVSNRNNRSVSFVDQYRPTQNNNFNYRNSNNNSNYMRNRYHEVNSRSRKNYNNHNHVRNNEERSTTRNSHVYMKNNELIIGSQHGVRYEQSIAANENRSSHNKGKRCDIYLGNVLYGTSYGKVKHMLNLMNISFTELDQLYNKHGYFQSYCFSVPVNKRNVVFDPKNWQKGLVVREFV